MNILNNSHDLAWWRGGTTDATHARTCHFFAVCLTVFLFLFRPWTFTIGFYGKKSIRTELMISECTFPLSPNNTLSKFSIMYTLPLPVFMQGLWWSWLQQISEEQTDLLVAVSVLGWLWRWESSRSWITSIVLVVYFSSKNGALPFLS